MGPLKKSAPRPVLVTAHPGHELLIHHWLETSRPLVMILTDGSGLFGQSRLEPSRVTLREAGAEIGPLFGIAADLVFYRAILKQDFRFFTDILDTVTTAIVEARPPRVVSEAVEFYLPVHDLTSAIATIAARRAASRLGTAIARYEFPIELATDQKHTPEREAIGLDAAAMARKLTAAQRNFALAHEVARVTALHPDLSAKEIFTRVPANRPAMPAPIARPHYEESGRARAAAGAVSEIITYAGHVAPLVEALESHAGIFAPAEAGEARV